MFDEKVLDFLSKEQPEVQVQIGQEFKPTGMIAPWKAGLQYVYGSKTQFAQESIGCDSVRESGIWFWYSWHSEAAALAAKKPMGQRWGPQQKWVWETGRDDILNMSEEGKEKWDANVSYSCNVAGQASKYGSEFNLLVLPLAVATVATMYGLDNPGFDVSEVLPILRQKEEETNFAHLELLIGGGKILMTDSILYNQRCELWRALGETNMEATRPIGALLPSGRPDTKKAATSEALSQCFKIYTHEWGRPTFCRMVPLPDLRAGAVSNSGKRLSLPGLYEMFLSVDAAKAAATVDLEMMADRATDREAAEEVDAGPPLPKAFAKFRPQWDTTMVAIVAQIESGAQLEDIYAKSGGQAALGCTITELQAWVDFKMGAPAAPAAVAIPVPTPVLEEDEIPF